MFEIHTNDHHFIHKAIFLGALILVLGVTMWTNVFAQRAIVLSVPTDFTVTTIDTPVSASSATGITKITPTSAISGSHTSNPATTSSGIVKSTTTVINTGSAQSTGVTSDVVIIYARKIEALIAVKGQETRSNMLIVMNRFLAKYTPNHPIYDTIARIVDIIKLGEVAYQLEYCTQFDDSYHLDLFGTQMKIHSTIKYAQATRRCEMTFQYPDQSVHSCRFDEQQKLLVAQMIKEKQGLNQDSIGLGQSKSSQIFESVIDSYLRDTTCFESQKAVIPKQTTVVTSTGTTESGTTTTTNRRQFEKS